MIVETIFIIFFMVIAIVLILLEIFLLPGMIAGIAGLVFATGSLIYAYMLDPRLGNWTLIVSAVVFIGSFFWLMRRKSFRRVALNKDVDSKLVSSRDLGINPGDEGITLSRLAPIGKARIKGVVVEAKALDELINENTPVEVTRVDGYNVIVKKIRKTNNHS